MHWFFSLAGGGAAQWDPCSGSSIATCRSTAYASQFSHPHLSVGFLSTFASQLLHSTCAAKCSGISGSEALQCTGGLFLACINNAASEICGILIALELQCWNAFLSAYPCDSPFSFLSSHEREGKKKSFDVFWEYCKIFSWKHFICSGSCSYRLSWLPGLTILICSWWCSRLFAKLAADGFECCCCQNCY